MSPSLGIFKHCRDVVLGNWLWVAQPDQGVGPDGPQRSLPASAIRCVYELCSSPQQRLFWNCQTLFLPSQGPTSHPELSAKTLTHGPLLKSFPPSPPSSQGPSSCEGWDGVRWAEPPHASCGWAPGHRNSSARWWLDSQDGRGGGSEQWEYWRSCTAPASALLHQLLRPCPQPL